MMIVLGFGTVCAEAPQFVSTFSVISNDHTPIPGRPKVLRWKKGKASILTKGPSSLTSVFGAYGLGRILDHQQTVSLGNSQNFTHICHLSVQVDRDNGTGT